MNNDLKQLVEFSKYLDTILDETKGVLKENIEIENMYNSMLEDKNKKQFIEVFLDIYPEINFDNIIDIENLSIDEFIIFLKRLSLSLNDSIMEYTINGAYINLIDTLKVENQFLYKNLSNIILLLDKYTSEFDLFKKKSIENIPFMSFEETKKNVLDFLSFIEPSGKIKGAFENYLEAGNIYVWEKRENIIPEIVKEKVPSDSYCDWAYYHNSVENYINAPLDNNLKDQISLVHEFFHHYIIGCKYGDNVILKEFPSIFFETIFGKYLIDLGYDEEMINKTIFYRIENHICSLAILKEISRLMIKKENKEDITIDDFIKKIDEEWIINNFPQEHHEKLLLFAREFNIKSRETVRERITEQIYALDYKFLSTTLSYLIGKVSTDKILEKETDIKEAARKVLAVKDIITSNEMSFHYLLSYFELWDYYFIIENTDTYNPTIPKRIEDKQLVKIKDI